MRIINVRVLTLKSKTYVPRVLSHFTLCNFEYSVAFLGQTISEHVTAD